ncbi:hypothetical protein LQR30_15695 [Chromobacterium piscinae]|uniref:hypothetical protein n=1 Tax=Chromobacterium piscinae TaxID=686831 RepID=UPI001E539813|nr:hypothetical protein [Chromobacterium piscinae]MCD4505542.1 hypothetical protein [Chromobacterium piscinae]
MWPGLWVKESGDVRKDAQYIRQLPTQAMRKAERVRLALVYGQGYSWDVQRAEDEYRPEHEANLPPLALDVHENPRAAALEAARRRVAGLKK